MPINIHKECTNFRRGHKLNIYINLSLGDGTRKWTNIGRYCSGCGKVWLKDEWVGGSPLFPHKEAKQEK